jgi:hypothetical protein
MSQDGNRHPLLILSENPLDGIWTHLSAFESEKFATKLIQERASQANVSVEEELLKRKATALAYCIRNARENLLSTAALSLTPRTIANYYGCLWLASALMVADPKSEIDLERLEKFTKFGHGLYRVPEILTLGRFPDARESDSTWRTQEVRHVGSDTIAPRFWCVPAAWFGEEDERRPSGPSASGARRNL